jgi:hypothetical protein
MRRHVTAKTIVGVYTKGDRIEDGLTSIFRIPELPNQLALLVATNISWSINYEFKSAASAKFIRSLQ